MTKAVGYVLHKNLLSRISGSKETKVVSRGTPIDGREEIEIIVELPRGLIAQPVRKLRVSSPVTAGEISIELAEKLNVNKERWKLFGSLNKESNPQKLAINSSLDQYRFDLNPNARLYFRPEITVK